MTSDLAAADASRVSAANTVADPALDESRIETLLTITRLISRWTSTGFQRDVALACGVALDTNAIRALYLLGIGEASSPSTLAAALGIPRPATSKLIARLDAAALVIRDTNPADRRASRLTLTPSGHEVFARLFSAGIDMLADATRSWDPVQLHEFTRLLGGFVDGLLAAGPAPTE